MSILTLKKKKSTIQLKLGKMAMCVIDEVSMVGSSMFQHVCTTLGKIKGRPDTNWGGICILAVGDLYQLLPNDQQPVYVNKKNKRMQTDLAPLLWDDFMFHELTQVMHQKDVEFAEVLNSIKQRQLEKDSGENTMLWSCEMLIGPDDASYPIDAMHVYATNE